MNILFQQFNMEYKNLIFPGKYLNEFVGRTGVKHDDRAIGEDCGRAGPHTIGIVPLIGDHG